MAHKDVSEERVKALLKIAPSYFSWEKAILDNGGKDCSKISEDQLEMTCFFHEDKRPSFRINKRLNVYHCFSCGRSGSIIKFMYELSGLSCGFYRYCDILLKSNPHITDALGFSTVFVDSKSLDPAFNQRLTFSVDQLDAGDISVTSLYKFLDSSGLESGDRWKRLAMSMSLIQQGFSRQEVWDIVRASFPKEPNSTSGMTLTSLIGASDG